MKCAVIGHLTADPELRVNPKGTVVGSFRIAENESRFNQDTQQWETVHTSYYNVTAFGQLAENIAKTLKRGSKAIVIGDLAVKPYEREDGSKSVRVDIRAREVGAALSVAFATLTKTSPAKDAPQPAQPTTHSGGDAHYPDAAPFYGPHHEGAPVDEAPF